MNSVLVLNQDYSPISVCSAERAFLLLYLKKAELMSEVQEKVLRSVSAAYPYPSVIRIQRYIRIPYKGVVLTRHNIFKRDGFECQYCGTGKDLTLDHLIPKSKGGKSSWTNLVTACRRCNTRKGDFSPEDVGLQLAKKPIRPTYVMFLKSTSSNLRADWLPYLKQKAFA